MKFWSHFELKNCYFTQKRVVVIKCDVKLLDCFYQVLTSEEDRQDSRIWFQFSIVSNEKQQQTAPRNESHKNITSYNAWMRLTVTYDFSSINYYRGIFLLSSYRQSSQIVNIKGEIITLLHLNIKMFNIILDLLAAVALSVHHYLYWPTQTCLSIFLNVVLETHNQDLYYALCISMKETIQSISQIKSFQHRDDAHTE